MRYLIGIAILFLTAAIFVEGSDAFGTLIGFLLAGGFATLISYFLLKAEEK